jgi:L-serine dehydratase
MDLSAFDMFTIGIGPSSSHTVGPMRAAKSFVDDLSRNLHLGRVSKLKIHLYGSLALTGRGHGTDTAILLGLTGYEPETIIPESVDIILEELRNKKSLYLGSQKMIDFVEAFDVIFDKTQRLELHSNGMMFQAFDLFDRVLNQQIYYSVGGGFILTHEQMQQPTQESASLSVATYPFKTMHDLKVHCISNNLTLQQLLLLNEKSWREEKEIQVRAKKIWLAMRHCAQRGLDRKGVLPGGLNVKRRAADLWTYLQQNKGKLGPSEGMEWLSVYALAINEENAAGGRVVTAPTNGAAGVIPAVMHYLIDHELMPSSSILEDQIAQDFLMIAGAVGVLYKMQASISAAEMGCQGEIGVASSMAAAAYCAALGGNLSQIEAAAEIAMEHHLGLTCDPIGGLVQIPCIERNTMGAVKAVTAGRLALRGSGEQKVSLDQVMKTMLQTGLDMNDIYKETSLGGLAVNVPEC